MQNLLNEIADGGGWAWTAVGNPQAVEKGVGSIGKHQEQFSLELYEKNWWADSLDSSRARSNLCV